MTRTAAAAAVGTEKRRGMRTGAERGAAASGPLGGAGVLREMSGRAGTDRHGGPCSCPVTAAGADRHVCGLPVPVARRCGGHVERAQHASCHHAAAAPAPGAPLSDCAVCVEMCQRWRVLRRIAVVARGRVCRAARLIATHAAPLPAAARAALPYDAPVDEQRGLPAAVLAVLRRGLVASRRSAEAAAQPAELCDLIHTLLAALALAVRPVASDPTCLSLPKL